MVEAEHHPLPGITTFVFPDHETAPFTGQKSLQRWRPRPLIYGVTLEKKLRRSLQHVITRTIILVTNLLISHWSPWLGTLRLTKAMCSRDKLNYLLDNVTTAQQINFCLYATVSVQRSPANFANPNLRAALHNEPVTNLCQCTGKYNLKFFPRQNIILKFCCRNESYLKVCRRGRTEYKNKRCFKFKAWNKMLYLVFMNNLNIVSTINRCLTWTIKFLTI